MDNSAEVREFLTTRRAKVSPADAGLPVVGQRRVAGLRRAEVASLAGISVEYYAKLERGTIAGVSASVLEGLARALQMDDAERTHLFDLARAADGTAALARPRRRSTGRWTPRPSLQWALDAITSSPAIVRNGRMDLLATNTLGWAMHSSLYEAAATGASGAGAGGTGAPPNFARYTFLDADARRFYPDWDTAAATAVAILRTEAGRAPHDKDLHDLVGELSTRSEAFRRLWGAHDVRLHGAGSKTFHHTAVGRLDLAYESMDMVSEPGLTLTIYAAEPASPTAEALRLLASWAASVLPARSAVDQDAPL
jgi:transcriptional regulator with XRE-family HTH domain